MQFLIAALRLPVPRSVVRLHALYFPNIARVWHEIGQNIEVHIA